MSDDTPPGKILLKIDITEEEIEEIKRRLEESKYETTTPWADGEVTPEMVFDL